MAADRRQRLREIAETLSRHGFGFLVGAFGLERHVPFHRGLLHHERREEPYTQAEHVRLALEELGATFIKLGPGMPETAWVALDPSSLPEGALLLHLLGGLPALPGAPLATLPERLRGQEVREVESVEHDGRTCRVYAAADTVPATGMRVDYTIAIDEDDIPCFVETGAGGITQGRDEYTDINAGLGIAPPTSATPVSIPPALATPIADD